MSHWKWDMPKNTKNSKLNLYQIPSNICQKISKMAIWTWNKCSKNDLDNQSLWVNKKLGGTESIDK